MPSRPCPTDSVRPAGPGPLSRTRRRSGVGGVLQLDLDGRAGCVAAGVGQRFLDDAVGGKLDTRRQRPDLPGHDQAHRRSRRAGPTDQLVEAVQPRLRAARIARVAGVIVVDPTAARRVDGAARSSCRKRSNRYSRAAHGPAQAHARRGQSGGVGLDSNHGDVMRDDVVEFAGDAVALGHGCLVALRRGDGTPALVTFGDRLTASPPGLPSARDATTRTSSTSADAAPCCPPKRGIARSAETAGTAAATRAAGSAPRTGRAPKAERRYRRRSTARRRRAAMTVAVVTIAAVAGRCLRRIANGTVTRRFNSSAVEPSEVAGPPCRRPSRPGQRDRAAAQRPGATRGAAVTSRMTSCGQS